MLGWREHKLESRLLGEISITAVDTTLMAESEEELKSPLMKVKEESDKVGLKLNTQKTKVMVSGPITSWQIDGETVETVADFILGGSKITADGNCSHEIKRRLILEQKIMTNLDSTLKSRDKKKKKAEEPEIKLATSAGSSKKQESSRKTSISVLLTMSKPLTVWITVNCGKFLNRWEYQTT